MTENKTFRFSVAMYVRAYGGVTTEAPDLDTALGALTYDYVIENFERLGSESDDIDYKNARDISLIGGFEGDNYTDIEFTTETGCVDIKNPPDIWVPFGEATSLINTIAGLFMDGDVIDQGDGPEEWEEFGNDDNVEALYSLITAARHLTSTRPDGFVGDAS